MLMLTQTFAQKGELKKLPYGSGHLVFVENDHLQR
jgi:hypothetical protein